MPVRIYVGDLGDSGDQGELQRIFSKYGRVSEVWVARNPPGFAFVFFDSLREAEDAVRNLDGTRMCGARARVELAKGPEKGEKPRYGPKCRECGRIGHSTRECTRRPGYVYRGPNTSFRRRSRSRSRSRDRDYRRRRDSYSRDDRRSRSRSNERSRRRSRSRSPYRGRNDRGRDDHKDIGTYNDDIM